MKIDKKINSITLASLAVILFLILVSSTAIAQSSPTKTYAYILNSGSNDVSVINTDTNKVITTIQVGSHPTGVAVSPNGKTVYVTNSKSNTISVINTAKNKVIATIPVGKYPKGVAFSPNGKRAYVANHGNISIIDTAKNTVITNITLIVDPHYLDYLSQIAVTPDGSKVFVTEGRSDRDHFFIIDTSTNKVTRSGLGSGYWNPRGIVINPQGTKAYIANKLDISIVDIKTYKRIGSIDSGRLNIGIAINPTGTRIYTTNESFSSDPAIVKIGDTKTNMIIASIAVGKSPSGISITPDGRKVYVANSGDNTVSVIDTKNNKVIATIPVGSNPVANGQFIAQFK
jgi:YVTN family beta-propeller protein